MDRARYRYTLSRRLDAGSRRPGARRGRCLFVMLNPSTADAHRDDPTIVRCMGFARRWGYRELRVVNLFALRATDPRDLRGLEPRRLIGRGNDAVLRRECRQADRVVAAWGAHGRLHGRAEAVLGRLAGVEWHCLGLTRGGEPRHPLRLPYRAILRPMGL